MCNSVLIVVPEIKLMVLAFAPIVSISGGQNEQFQIRYKNNNNLLILKIALLKFNLF